MKTKLIKSPLNYIGGKYKLLPQILPLFPKKIDTFIDLFCGGFNVGINVNANKIIGNDLCKEVIQIYKGIQIEGHKNSLKLIKEQIDKYDLSKFNEEGYKKIRNYYNTTDKSWYIFYAMISHAFNYQIRFNKHGKYNMPFGKNRSYFNATLEKHLMEFSLSIENKNIIFTNKSFEDLKIDSLTDKDFVYLDPPYLLGCASYNEQNGWNKYKEKVLINLCDELDKHGVKFALSN
ncbi:TPA: Dam family site-specific DNA-(adenine-N6)-methyltransferase [Clostridioides difficile]|nr:Dam family site-specific DNA-(adenine-N6)-methyltransferase [Clostridioides difficile]